MPTTLTPHTDDLEEFIDSLSLAQQMEFKRLWMGEEDEQEKE
jgi:hypothetical protein